LGKDKWSNGWYRPTFGLIQEAKTPPFAGLFEARSAGLEPAGRYERLFNEDLIELGLARTTTFAHTYRREFERAREEAEERGAGLWSACPNVTIP
jgi:Staphylococcal nuclease homologue